MQSDTRDFNINTPGAHCSGVIFMSPSLKTADIMKKAYDLILDLPPGKLDDQRILNEIMEARTLDPKAYPNGYRYFNHREKCWDRPILIHNNHIKGLEAKIDRFMKNGLWYLETYAGYDPRQQTSVGAINAVREALQKYEDPNILVFGSGYDAGVWHHLSNNTVILEHEDKWAEIGREKGADVRKVSYVNTKGDLKLAKDIAKKNVNKWLESLDPDIKFQKWDIIIIDGPQGGAATRAMPIYASIYLSNEGGTIFVDDYNRKAETELVEELKEAGMHLSRVVDIRDGLAEVINP